MDGVIASIYKKHKLKRYFYLFLGILAQNYYPKALIISGRDLNGFDRYLYIINE